MRPLRTLGDAILWVIAVLGVLSVVVFGATKLGHLKPLVVISGSMEPTIMTGDLLFDTPHPTSDLKVGDVASIPSTVTGKLISHRVVAIAPKDGHYEVHLKGDANESVDAETYEVGGTVWRPVLQVPHGGLVVTKLTQRGVAIPLAVTLLALLGLTLLPGQDDRPQPPSPDRAPAEAPTAADDEDADGPAESYFPDRIADLTGASGR
jgi:signal peptidase I